MIEKLHEFFFGDQLRKYIVLIGSILGSQILSILFLRVTEPSQYLLLTLCFSIVLALLLAVLYTTIRAKFPKQSAKQSKANNLFDGDFRKSSITYQLGFLCVEVAFKEGYVAVRNSTDLRKVTVVFTNDEWNAFIKGVKLGEFDIPESTEDKKLDSRWREIRACNDSTCGESKSQNSHDSLLDLTF